MTPRASRANPLGRIGLLLFGLVFLGTGLGVGYFFALPDLYTWISARDYVTVKAELLDVDLRTHRGKNSNTYEVKAVYLYHYGERRYTSERVAIGSGADNIGSYQQDLYKRLNAAKQRRTTVTAWVNPANPNEALLDREIRWGLFALKGMFFLVFASVGLGVLIYGFRAAPAVPASMADKPWLADPAWRDGRVTSGSRAAVFGMWGIAVLWNAISTPLLFIVPAELGKQNWAALLGLLFPVAGLWLLYRAIHKTLQWRRFGALVLTLHPFPGAVGGAVGGTVELPERFRPGQRIRISLTCVHRRASADRERNVSERAVWQNETSAAVETSGRGSRVSFRFSVPADVPPTAPRSNDHHYWTVHLHAEIEGVDLDHTFEIPVAVADGAAVATETAVSSTPATAPEIPADIVRIEQHGGTTVFYYPAFRYPSLGIGLVLFSLIFDGATIFLYSQAKGFSGIIAGFMALVFGLFAIGMLLLGLYCLGNSLRIEISPRGLTSIRRVFGIPFATHVPLDEISGIEPKIGSQSGSAGKFNVRYALHALRHAGRRVAVGDDIPGQPLAEHIAGLLRTACGLRPARS